MIRKKKSYDKFIWIIKSLAEYFVVMWFNNFMSGVINGFVTKPKQVATFHLVIKYVVQIEVHSYSITAKMITSLNIINQLISSMETKYCLYATGTESPNITNTKCRLQKLELAAEFPLGNLFRN
jgi:hypothetical protein